MPPRSLMEQGQGLSTAAAFACFTVAAAKLGLVFRETKMQASCATEFSSMPFHYVKVCGGFGATDALGPVTFMQMLFMVGPYLQEELGWKMFTALYFVAGAAANVAEYIGNVLMRSEALCSFSPLAEPHAAECHKSGTAMQCSHACAFLLLPLCAIASSHCIPMLPVMLGPERCSKYANCLQAQAAVGI